MKTPLLVLLFCPLHLFSQDFTGLWTGFMYTAGNQVPYELVISNSKNQLTGYSLSVFSINGVENTGMKRIKVRGRKKGIVIEDDEMIYNNYSTTAKLVTLFSTLSLQNGESALILQGPFFTRSVDKSSFKGNIRLEKKNASTETRMTSLLKQVNLWNDLSFIRSVPADKENGTLAAAAKTGEKTVNDSTSGKEENATSAKVADNANPASLTGQKKEISPPSVNTVVNPKPSVAPFKVAAAEINKRKTEVIRSVFFQSDSLVLSLYDNGQVDGDTVSVVVNDRIVIARQGLTTNAITTTLYANPQWGDSLRLVMYAENLGTIPPNTGLLIIQDGSDRHQIRFEGDLQKNPAIILRRKR